MAIGAALVALAGSLGFTSHLGYFIHGEHHTKSWQIFIFSIILPPLALLPLMYGFRLLIQDAISYIVVVMSTYLSTLAMSIFLYRGLFHRLRGYPGPLLAKFSNFYHTVCLFKWQNYKLLQKWHDEYGSYVRTGV